MPRFAFAFDSALSASLRLIGIGPQTTSVLVGDGYLDVRSGLWRVRMPISNLKDVAVTGPYNPLTALGCGCRCRTAG
jgi:hypothetical protein